MNTQQKLQTAILIPVVTIERAEDAVPLAKALLDGGISVIEVTLRTRQSLQAIEAIAKNVPDMLVGAGTIIEPTQFEQTQNAGASFFISPGFSPELAQTAIKQNLCFIPGVTSPSEIIQASHHGLTFLKFFPAEAAGGVTMLKALMPVFQDIQFCPTGGVNLDNMHSYLALNNVCSIGGGWLAPKKDIDEKNWKNISTIAKESLAMLKNKD